jgi:hypothetical protein
MRSVCHVCGVSIAAALCGMTIIFSAPWNASNNPYHSAYIHSVLNVNLTTAVFVSFGDINITSCFFVLIYIRKKLKNRFTPVNTVRRRIYFLSKTLLVSQNFVTSRCTVLFGTSLSGYASLNASRTIAKDFYAK